MDETRNDQLQKKYEDLAQGSIYDVANSRGEKAEEVLARSDVVVMLDVSGSMAGRVTDGETKWDIAVEQLRDIQRSFPGRVVLIDFHSTAEIRLSGIPVKSQGSTNMSEALGLAHDFDGLDTKFYLISDGVPDNKNTVLDWATSYRDPINTIFIGLDTDRRGIELLEQVSSLSGGEATGKIEPRMLGETVTKLLTN